MQLIFRVIVGHQNIVRKVLKRDIADRGNNFNTCYRQILITQKSEKDKWLKKKKKKKSKQIPKSQQKVQRTNIIQKLITLALICEIKSTIFTHPNRKHFKD